jgi:hypothetical protein
MGKDKKTPISIDNKEYLGRDDTVEEGLTAQIEAQKNPVQETGLPWATA